MLYYSMCVSLSRSPGPSSVSLKCSQVVSASATPEMLVEKDPALLSALLSLRLENQKRQQK